MLKPRNHFAVEAKFKTGYGPHHKPKKSERKRAKDALKKNSREILDEVYFG